MDLAVSFEAALMWFQMAAEGGNVISQYVLGWVYENGKLNLTVNLEVALICFKKAADSGCCVEQC